MYDPITTLRLGEIIHKERLEEAAKNRLLLEIGVSEPSLLSTIGVTVSNWVNRMKPGARAQAPASFPKTKTATAEIPTV